MEDWEVEENININVVEDIKESYPQSFMYVEAQVNVFNEIPQSYSHKGNLKLDQTGYTTETWFYESMGFGGS
jgi:hypothetical protein